MLTLLKGDKIVYRVNIITNSLLFGKICPRYLDGFHAFYINASSITYSVHMRFQILFYKFL